MSSIGYHRHQAALAAKHLRDGFAARFPGICRKCPTPITPGEQIVGVMGGGFAHIDCPQTEDAS